MIDQFKKDSAGNSCRKTPGDVGEGSPVACAKELLMVSSRSLPLFVSRKEVEMSRTLPRPLSTALVNDFKENGYTLIPQVIPEAVSAAALKVCGLSDSHIFQLA
tara:strand:+ start:275 stop:586 length:312 start_codon:yes stop_codon:yes gene_type:complete